MDIHYVPVNICIESLISALKRVGQSQNKGWMIIYSFKHNSVSLLCFQESYWQKPCFLLIQYTGHNFRSMIFNYNYAVTHFSKWLSLWGAITVWWLVFCVNLTRPQSTQIYEHSMFLWQLFLKINIKINRLNKGDFPNIGGPHPIN